MCSFLVAPSFNTMRKWRFGYSFKFCWTSHHLFLYIICYITFVDGELAELYGTNARSELLILLLKSWLLVLKQQNCQPWGDGDVCTHCVRHGVSLFLDNGRNTGMTLGAKQQCRLCISRLVKDKILKLKFSVRWDTNIRPLQVDWRYPVWPSGWIIMSCFTLAVF